MGQLSSWAGATAPMGQTIDDLPEEWVRILGAPLRGLCRFSGRPANASPHVAPAHRAAFEKCAARCDAAFLPRACGKNAADAARGRRHRRPSRRTRANRHLRLPLAGLQCPLPWRGLRLAAHAQRRSRPAIQQQPLEGRQGRRAIRSEGKFRGGVGLYPEFVHVDTRGRNADWRV